jgi:hypothetical protein
VWTKADYGPDIASEQKLWEQDHAEYVQLIVMHKDLLEYRLGSMSASWDGDNDARYWAIKEENREANTLEKYALLIVVVE